MTRRPSNPPEKKPDNSGARAPRPRGRFQKTQLGGSPVARTIARSEPAAVDEAEGDALFEQLLDGGMPVQGGTDAADVVRPVTATSNRASDDTELPRDEPERETLLFSRGDAPRGPALPALRLEASDAEPPSTDSAIAVDALPVDRGSTYDLDVEEIELVGDVAQLFDVMVPHVAPADGLGGPDHPTVRDQLRESEGATDFAEDERDGVIDPSGAPSDDELSAGPGTEAAGDVDELSDDFARRGVYPRIELPPEVLAGIAPPIAAAQAGPAVPAPIVSDPGMEILLEDLEFIDGPAPPSKASLVAARESVAGWLASAEGLKLPQESEEIVLSIEDIEDSASAGVPASTGFAQGDSTEIFVATSEEFDAAVVGLIERGQRQGWLERARRMLAEAPTSEPAARASTLLVVSELLAIGGENEEAEKVALEALSLAPNSPMVQRQVRGILATRRQWPEVINHLSRELRTAPTAESRAHAAFLAAEVARVAQSDMQSASRFVDRAVAASPDDVRGPLARWVLALGNIEANLDAPTGLAADAFKNAAIELAALRSNGAEGAGARSRYGRLLAARAGLRRRDPAVAMTVLDECGSAPGLSGASAWLAAVLGAPEASLATEVHQALERAASGTHHALAQRALVAHALERSQNEMVADAVRNGDHLVPVDRMFLAAMLPTEESLPAPAELLVAALEASEDEMPVVAAAAAALGAPMPMAVAPGDEVGKLKAALARQLVRMLSEPSPEEALRVLAPTSAALLDVDPESGAARAWTIERRFVTKQLAAVGEAIPGGDDEQRALAAGLFAEMAVPPAPLPSSLSSLAPMNEAALQMVVSRVSAGEAASTLEMHASRTDDAGAALLLTAAACRLPPDVPRADQIWIRAHERDPSWPVAPLFAFAAALRVRHESSARQWLARCNLDPVHEQVLLGLRIHAAGSRERIMVLEDAHLRRPADYALRDQLELAAGRRDDRAAWLAERASERAAGYASLALEAALLFELEGDPASAAIAAGMAHEQGPSPIGDVATRRLACEGFGVDAVTYRLESALLRTGDPAFRRDLAAELARIELRGRRDGVAAARRYREAVDAGAPDIAVFLEAERALFSLDAPGVLGHVELHLARALANHPEAMGHAMLAVRRATRGGDLALAFDAAQIAAQATRRSSWSLRQLASLSLVRRDHEGLWRACSDLAERTHRPLERAALLCRASEAALAIGDGASAASLLGEVTKAWPRHPIARLLRATLLERAGALVEAAVAYEELAGMSRNRKDRAERCYRAAGLWLASNDPRGPVEGQRLLEAACDLDPDHAAAFERLQAIYLAGGARMELAELLSQRVRTVADPLARGDLEVLRGKMLAEAGASSEAKVALAASLKVRPDDVEGWRAYAEVSFAEGDGDAAEHALLQLGRLLTDPRTRAEVFLRLGDVYARLKPNLDRAARSYREAEKLDPSRVEVRERLIELQAVRGDRVGALAAQRELCDGAKTPEEFVARTIGLASLHDRLGDHAEAERLLVDLRRHHPAAARPLRALHTHYVQHGKRALADALVERAPADLSRMLVAGHTEDGIFDVAVTAAELRGRSDGIAVARAVRAAAHGGKGRLGAAGGRAASPTLDDWLAPEPFGPALRELLAATGHVLDALVPFDSLGIRTRPFVHHDELAARAREIAAAHGVPNVELVIANTLSATVLPVSTSPVVLCVGAPLLDPSMSALVDLCIHRAMTLVRTRTAALTRIAPIDQVPTLAAYLRLHEPALEVPGTDPSRVAEIEATLRSAGGDRFVAAQHAELARAALEVVGARGAALGATATAWSWHVATLATGELGLVFDAMSFATSAVGAPSSEAERLRWLGKHVEARELLGFLVGEAYLEARSRLGMVSPL
ncbi:MAG: hypothetical protein FJ096_03960 [Deltaproteobacteria bacterium]|nr:hypothetical protein [Deltaproteobacteria bacterium]